MVLHTVWRSFARKCNHTYVHNLMLGEVRAQWEQSRREPRAAVEPAAHAVHRFANDGFAARHVADAHTGAGLQFAGVSVQFGQAGSVDGESGAPQTA